MPRSLLTVLAAFALAALAGIAPAQVDAAEAIAAAEQALANKRGEDAVIALVAARKAAAAIADATERARLLARIAALTTKADQDGKAVAAAARDAAGKLIQLVDAYEARGWRQTALAFAQHAEHAQPGSATAASERLRAALATAPAAAGPATTAAMGMHPWFAQGEPVTAHKDWRRGEDHVQAPALSGADREQAIYLAALRARAGSLDFTAEVRWRGKGEAGLVFGYRQPADFFALQFIPDGGSYWCALVRYQPSGSTVLAQGQGSLPPPPPPAAGADAPATLPLSTMPVSIKVRAETIEATVGTTALTARAAVPAGFVGLQTFHTGDEKFTATFAALRVRAATWLMTAPKGAAPTDAAAVLGAARAKLAAGDAEGAAADLRDLRDAAPAAGNGGNREHAEALAATLTAADPGDQKARPLLEGACRDLLRAGQPYDKRRWFLAALVWYELAVELCPRLAQGACDAARQSTRGGAATTAATITAWFTDGKPFAGGGYWRVADGEVQSPALTGDSVGFRSTRKTGRNYRIEVAVLASAAPSKIALAFGLHPSVDGDDYYLLELRHFDGGSQLRLLHVHGVQIAELASRTFQLTAQERADFVDLSVAVEGDRIRCALADLADVDIRAVTQDLAGCIGFYVSGDSPYSGPTRARNLRLHSL